MVDGRTRLHGHKRSPVRDGGAVEQAGDEVTEDQNHVCPVTGDIGPEVPTAS